MKKFRYKHQILYLLKIIAAIENSPLESVKIHIFGSSNIIYNTTYYNKLKKVIKKHYNKPILKLVKQINKQQYWHEI